MDNSIKTLYFIKAVDMVSTYCCEDCGQDRPKKDFNRIEVACGEYVCTDCKWERAAVEVEKKGGVA